MPSPSKSPASAVVQVSAVDQVAKLTMEKAELVLWATRQTPVEGTLPAMSARPSPLKSPTVRNCQATTVENVPQGAGVAVVPLAGVSVTHQRPSAPRQATSPRPSPLKSPASVSFQPLSVGRAASAAVVTVPAALRLITSSAPDRPTSALGGGGGCSVTVKESSTKSLALNTDVARTVIVVDPGTRGAPYASCSRPWGVIDTSTAARLLLVAVYTSSPERAICGNFTNWSAVSVVVSTGALVKVGLVLGLAPGTFRSGTVSNGEA